MLSRIAIPTLAMFVLAAACSESPTSRTLSPAGTVSSRDEGPGNSQGEDNGDNGNRVQSLRLRDDCDSTSFNAALGAGACVGNGGTTLAEFNAELAKKGFVGAWKMNPDHFGGAPGTVIDVTNRGGETHTFTPVVAFGGGIVPALNQASGNTTVAPECANLNPQTIVPSGGHLPGTPLTVGTHRFQCCIHPWMRTTATIRTS